MARLVLTLFTVLPLAALVAPAMAQSAAQSVADFYRGKTITMAVGTSPGGDYDLRMRMVGRYLGKYIPGNPTVVATNMPGAGQMLVANWLANVAPKDGTAIVALSQNLAVHQATGAAGARYDVRQFHWIGNTTDTPNVINAWHSTGIRTIQDVMQRELVVGATGTASGSFLYPYALNQLVGTKFKIVTGYPGGNDVNLAMERGEVGGRGSNSWASWKSTRPQWLAEKKVIVLVQVGVKRSPELPDIPTLQDLAKNEADRQVLTFISADTAISRPLVAGPGVPPERVEALRRAFDAVMKDPEFLAEAEKSKTDISPMTGEEAQKIAEATINAPADVRSRAGKLIEGK
jgi:tripartite-type tricarboxylate transporter receptor subunit TctC